MGRKLRLKEVADGQSTRVYTLVDIDRDEDRIQEYFERESRVMSCSDAQRITCSTHYRCRNRCFRMEYLTDLWTYMYEVAPKRGFRFDDKPSLAHAKLYKPLPLGTVKAGPFRIYGLFLGSPARPLFVATGGGYKRTQNIQQDPLLTIEFDFTKACMKAMRRARICATQTISGTPCLTPNYEDTVLTIN